MYSRSNTAILFALSSFASVLAEPAMTPAAQLAPRATDPSFVGYISQGGSYFNPRTCDYPQTVSTSGNYVQCCPTTGSCAFYTTCSANTLFGAGLTVACDVTNTLTCNTGIVLATAGASGGPSYLACWQTSLGTSPFTIVQNIGSATPAVASTATSGASASTVAAVSGNSAQTSASSSGSQSTMSQTSQGTSSMGMTASSSASASAASVSSSSSKAAAPSAVGELAGSRGNILGSIVALLAPFLL